MGAAKRYGMLTWDSGRRKVDRVGATEGVITARLSGGWERLSGVGGWEIASELRPGFAGVEVKNASEVVVLAWDSHSAGAGAGAGAGASPHVARVVADLVCELRRRGDFGSDALVAGELLLSSAAFRRALASS